VNVRPSVTVVCRGAEEEDETTDYTDFTDDCDDGLKPILAPKISLSSICEIGENCG
jgi:hypothetical protein